MGTNDGSAEPVDARRGEEAVDDRLGAEPVDAMLGEETVEALPVLAELRTIEPVRPAALPTLSAAAAAATGFVAGAATFALARRLGARRLARSGREVVPPRRPADVLPVAGSRTYLVNVRLIAKPGE